MTNAETRMRSCYDTLSDTEKRAADYFFGHAHQIFNLPVAQLAQQSGVSPAAWIRLCKSVGYTGLKDMRKELYAERGGETASGQPDVHFADLNEGGSAEDILRTVAATSAQAVRDTAKLLDPEAVRRAVDCLLGARAVALFGIGASALVAEDFYHKLLRIRKNALFSRDSHVQLGYSATLTEEDAAVFISNSGATEEMLQAMEAAKGNGCRVVGVTRYGKSRLAAGCDILLSISSPEAYVRSGAMSSRIAQLMAVDVLYTVLASRDYEHIKEPLESSYRICTTHRITAED